MTSEFRVFTQRATLNSLRKMVRYLQDPAKVLPLVDDEGTTVGGHRGHVEVMRVTQRSYGSLSGHGRRGG